MCMVSQMVLTLVVLDADYQRTEIRMSVKISAVANYSLTRGTGAFVGTYS